MSNKLTTSLRTLRDGVLDFEDALANRVNGLFITGQVMAVSFINTMFNEGRDIVASVAIAGFAVTRNFVSGAFSLVRATTVVVIGNRTDPLDVLLVNEADYNAGFADGRKGMVPARTKRTAK